MQKQAPSTFQMATIIGFTLSCFGLLLFLWVSFGGPTPLAARGYEFKVPFTEASLLANQSDVRISGVSVGKVSSIELGSGDNAGRALATIELDDTYAPVPNDTRATLRQKTLLGETYVELTPGNPKTGNLPDGGEIPKMQVAPSVQLDEIFRTFNEKTRAAFQNWMIDASVALKGRGADLNTTFGLLEPTFTDANKVLRILDTQGHAVRQLVRNTGVVFSALSARQGQLASLIRNSNAVFQTTAQRDQDLANLFVVLPTFEKESTLTLNRLDRFATNADPVIQQLIPVARSLTPVLIATGRLAPVLRDFLRGLGPVIAAAPIGLPGLRKFLRDDLPPLLSRLEPFLNELDPLLQTAGLYKNSITALLGNGAAVTNGKYIRGTEAIKKTVNYLRTGVPLGPDSLSAYPRRLLMNRTNPYFKPLGLNNLPSGLESFETRQCSGGIHAIYRPWTSLTPAEQATFTTASGGIGQDLYDRLKEFAMVNITNSNNLPRPACQAQGPYAPLGQTGRPATKYQHVFSRP